MEGQETSSKTIVFDADFIPFYACNNKKDQPIKTLDDCLQSADSIINSSAIFIGADKFTGFITKGKCFRYKINTEYKANRKYDNLPEFINDVKEYVVNKYQFKSVEGYEADDCVLSFKVKNPDCIIVSPDKDILNLEGYHFNPRKGEFKYTTKDEADIFFWSSMLIGDTIDGIKGVNGCGAKCAEKLFADQDTVKLRSIVLDKYCSTYGEYKGIQEFTKNYLSLKLVDNVDYGEVKLNNVERTLCE